MITLEQKSCVFPLTGFRTFWRLFAVLFHLIHWSSSEFSVEYNKAFHITICLPAKLLFGSFVKGFLWLCFSLRFLYILLFSFSSQDASLKWRDSSSYYFNSLCSLHLLHVTSLFSYVLSFTRVQYILNKSKYYILILVCLYIVRILCSCLPQNSNI